MTPKSLWHAQDQTNMVGLKFYPFHSTIIYFWVSAQLGEWCMEWPHNDLNILLTLTLVKSIHLHTTCAYEAQIFIRFALPWAIFKSCPIQRQVHQMTLTCSRWKIPVHILHMPPRPKFLLVLLYDEQFSSYGTVWRKVYQGTPTLAVSCLRSIVPCSYIMWPWSRGVIGCQTASLTR